MVFIALAIIQASGFAAMCFLVYTGHPLVRHGGFGRYARRQC